MWLGYEQYCKQARGQGLSCRFRSTVANLGGGWQSCHWQKLGYEQLGWRIDGEEKSLCCCCGLHITFYLYDQISIRRSGQEYRHQVHTNDQAATGNTKGCRWSQSTMQTRMRKSPWHTCDCCNWIPRQNGNGRGLCLGIRQIGGRDCPRRPRPTQWDSMMYSHTNGDSIIHSTQQELNLIKLAREGWQQCR